jgi:hypothetical protein
LSISVVNCAGSSSTGSLPCGSPAPGDPAALSLSASLKVVALSPDSSPPQAVTRSAAASTATVTIPIRFLIPRISNSSRKAGVVAGV